MGFCRRCGDICNTDRCKCGGLPAAPVVKWGQGESSDQPRDRWSQTYTREKSPQPTRPLSQTITGTIQPTPTGNGFKRFSRPKPSVQTKSFSLDNRVSAHIRNTTDERNRPASPLKQGFHIDDIVAGATADILVSPETHELSKAYGSVLQPKESLSSFTCKVCATPFPPDATIYPDPNFPAGEHFLCRPCFVSNGGSKGDCQVCSRPVLILKKEGGFVENSGRVWHKTCFKCLGCGKAIGDRPMVDLLGRPSCADCFDSCLKRKDTPTKKPQTSPVQDKRSSLGGMKAGRENTREAGSREGSPVTNELEQRLGIVKKAREEALHNTTSPQMPTNLNAGSRYTTISSAGEENSLSSRNRTFSAGHDASPFSTRSRTYSTGTATTTPIRSTSRSRERWAGSNDVDSFGSASTTPGRAERARYNSSTSASSRVGSPSAKSMVVTEEAVEEMKRRFLRSSASSSSLKSPSPLPSTPPLRISKSPSPTRRSSPTFDTVSPSASGRMTGRSLHKVSSTSSLSTALSSSTGISALSLNAKNFSLLASPATNLSSTNTSPAATSSSVAPSPMPNTPDLMSDNFSEAGTHSSGVVTPPSFSPPSAVRRVESFHKETIYDVPPIKTTRTTSTPTVYTTKRQSFGSSTEIEPLKPAHTGSQVMRPIVPHKTGTYPSNVPVDEKCAKCSLPLLTSNGGKFVTVPEEHPSANLPPKTYHADCFRCRVCDGMFREHQGGHAVFVRGERGACHVKCAPPSKTIKANAFPDTSRASNTIAAEKAIGKRFELPPKTAPPTQTSFAIPEPTSKSSTPRFGGSNRCPGCQKSVSIMEPGVVPGPQGTRWHGSCLVCGGKEVQEREKERAWGRIGRSDGKKTPGCGKKLDSAAKTDVDGNVWCRACMLMLPALCTSPQGSPTRSPVVPGGSFWSSRPAPSSTGRVVPQFTGSHSLVRQHTGMADSALLRQLTGGGLSPTRQLNPQATGSGGVSGMTRQYTGQLGASLSNGTVVRPRPKSVTGFRSTSTKSVDEGRGVFLMRQLTGGS